MTATLNEIYNARSIALIGASQDPNKAGYQVLKLLIDEGYEGKVFPVHPKESEILGLKCYPSILDIPDAVDIMVVAVSAKVVLNVMKQAEQRGDVKGAVVLSAGFAETAVPELVEAEAELVKIAKRAGIRVFGPNCIGMAYPAMKLNTGFAPGIKLVEGPAAYVSQSGAFGGALLMFAGDQPCPQGFAKFGHIGNMCDVSNLELIEAFNNDPSVNVTGVYMEAVKDGRELMNIAAASEKPNLILKVGRSSLGAAAAMSHTGSLAGSDKVYDGAFKQCGIVRMETVEDMTDGMKAVSSLPKPKGNRVCVLTEAGGMGIVSMDAIDKTELVLASIGGDTLAKLEETLPSMAMICKPDGYIDMTAAVSPEQQAASLHLVLADSGVDAVLLLGLPPIFRDPKDAAKQISPVAKEFDKPVAVCFMRGESMAEGRRHFEENGIMTFDTPERAVKALETLYRAAFRNGHALEDLPAAPRHPLVEKAVAEGRNLLEPEAVALLADNGIPTVDHAFATSREEAQDAVEKFGKPVVLKVVSPDVIHKSDAGGVKVNIRGRSEMADAYDDMMSKVVSHVPGADIRGAMVVPLAEPGTEIIIGMVRDPQFGPTIMFGLGGIFVEVFKDVSFRVAPFNKEVALDMIKETKAFELLSGVRGEAAKDIDSLVDLLVKVSRMAATHPEINEIDLNPVRIYEQGLAVLDARVILSSGN
ncbi:MAG: acetate--CoA ligase family protein [Desulfovibrio sp.]|uniref:acetate--CoA ligase family protein n=1 Tax=Desulfovibrio sp. 7SRBS1 TaxID=3378064 RepID=UPI003B3EA29B